MIQHIPREQVQSLILKERFHNPKEMQDFPHVYKQEPDEYVWEWDSKSVRPKKTEYDRPNLLIWVYLSGILDSLLTCTKNLLTWTQQ